MNKLYGIIYLPNSATILRVISVTAETEHSEIKRAIGQQNNYGRLQESSSHVKEDVSSSDSVTERLVVNKSKIKDHCCPKDCILHWFITA